MSRHSSANVKQAPVKPTITAEERHQMIAEAAYYLAEKRGFEGGDPQADWLEAESAIEAQIGIGSTRSS